MKKILDIISKAIKDPKNDVDCLPCERFNIDYDKFAEYKDSLEHRASGQFENPRPSSASIKLEMNKEDTPSILKYFLDGSRRTYKVADLKLKGRYLPLIAGQVAVGVTFRDDNNTIRPLRQFCKYENVLAFPDEISNPDDIKFIVQEVNNEKRIALEGLIYKVKDDRDPVDLAVAKVMTHMHDMELNAVNSLSKQCLLNSNSLLVKDGPLRYKNFHGQRFDVTQFRNVVGVSKRFQPSFSLGKNSRNIDVGALTYSLEMGERTSVFKVTEEERDIGMWYIRIRKRDNMSNPLQGIIKVECYAIGPEEEELGLDSERVNTISEYLLRERNVTPYGQDIRWASHLYPIYLTESYIKANMMSDIKFMGFF